MPAEERSSRLAERCAEHPGRQAVGGCEACGRPLCVACAVPVRGRVVGVECVVSVLGEHPQPAVKPGWSRAALTAGGGLAAVVVASVLPWTRFGVGSGFLGGWDAVPSWSLLASVVGVATIGLWSMAGPNRRGAAVVASIGGVIAATAALLAAAHPPSFTKPWVGPALAFAGGATAFVASAIEARRQRRVR